MGEKGVGKLSRETPPPREGEPMGANHDKVFAKMMVEGTIIPLQLDSGATINTLPV